MSEKIEAQISLKSSIKNKNLFENLNILKQIVH